jgi:tRNA(Arg) A34 adenosine deaminase TadA
LDFSEEFLRRAIELAAQARSRGNHPFGALLALDNSLLLTAENTVNTERDPTAHAETNLIRRAVHEIEPQKLSRSTLYTSCEPCAMCVGAIYWAGVRKVVYALAAEELARLAGGDFLVPCRELFSKAQQRVEVAGPLLYEEAVRVHEGYWR